MARVRAADYDGKRQAILDRSAVLFAKHGYDRTSMAEVAKACGVSKALLYHYYVSKDALLFDILQAHLQELIDAAGAVDQSLSPRARLRALVGALLEAYRDADHEHKIQINELGKLPSAKKKLLTDMERKLVRIFAEAIAAVNPAVGREQRLLKPITMSLFGMLNWHYMWFRAQGALSREDYADLATTLLVEGAAALVAAENGRSAGRAARQSLSR
jgi:TetR/AcrR family transcriptional regulator